MPQVFGCVSYVHSHHLPSDKLSVKALKCVFVGYSNTHEGYKCFHPLTRRVMMAKDIVFDENCFYYQSNIVPKGEQEIIKREILTPLPFLDIRDKQDIQPSQEIQKGTVNSDSQTATNGKTQPSTYPKYYMRRNKQPTTHTQHCEEGVTSRVTPEEDTS